MNLEKLYNRSLSLLSSPVKEWEMIREENKSVRDIKRSVLFPYGILISVFTFFGTLFSYLHSPAFTSFYLLILALIEFIVIYLHTVFSAWILYKLAANMDETNTKRKVFTLVNYSYIPFYLLLAITKLLPPLMLIIVGSAYSIYIFWRGLPIMLNIPKERKKQFVIISVILSVTVFIILSQILTLLYSAITREFTTFGG